jgi:hypothetical protein
MKSQCNNLHFVSPGGSRRAGFSCDLCIFDVYYSGCSEPWGAFCMEIVLALIIGLAVTGVVFVLGRTFAVSGRAAAQVQHQPELLISASVSPDAASDPTGSIVHEAETARTAGPVPPHRDVQKAPKKPRKQSAGRSQEDAAKTPSRRRRKTNKPTAPAIELGTPATTGPSPGP